MKTPIQEFYNFMDEHQYFIGNDLFKKYHELLEKEKEVIQRAYKQGVIDEYGDTIDLDTITEAEEYYNRTFNTKEKWKMKITNKQLQMLMVLLQDSQADVRGLFSFDLETRNKLLNEIINQQDSELIDITTNTKG